MDDLRIYRKRLIPDECILLKDDTILETTPTHIITKWNTLNPRSDFEYGYSCYFLKEGYKISKLYRTDHSLLYWYCDIVQYTYYEADRSLIVTDLLADVVIEPDGTIKVLDANELADALEQKLCSPSLIAQSLRRLDALLCILYANKFDTLSSYIEKWTTK